jgi:hypothetical protein
MGFRRSPFRDLGQCCLTARLAGVANGTGGLQVRVAVVVATGGRTADVVNLCGNSCAAVVTELAKPTVTSEDPAADALPVGRKRLAPA